MNQPHHFLQRFKLMKLFSVFGSPGHTFNIGRRVASHFPNGHLFALKRHKSSCMLNNHLQLFFRR